MTSHHTLAQRSSKHERRSGPQRLRSTLSPPSSSPSPSRTLVQQHYATPRWSAGPGGTQRSSSCTETSYSWIRIRSNDTAPASKAARGAHATRRDASTTPSTRNGPAHAIEPPWPLLERVLKQRHGLKHLTLDVDGIDWHILSANASTPIGRCGPSSSAGHELTCRLTSCKQASGRLDSGSCGFLRRSPIHSTALHTK